MDINIIVSKCKAIYYFGRTKNRFLFLISIWQQYCWLILEKIKLLETTLLQKENKLI